MKKTILITIILVALSSCGLNSSPPGVKGNGKLTTKKREVKSNFSTITSKGSIDIVLSQEDKNLIKITAEENIIPLIEVRVENDELFVNYKANTTIRTTKKAMVYINYKAIENLNLKGSGNVKTSNSIKSANLNLNLIGSGDMLIDATTVNLKSTLNGSGDIKLKGTSNNYDCVLKGSGDVNAFGLQAKNVIVNLKGSGNAEVYSDEKINANLIGSGNIYFKGKPKVENKYIKGSGDIRAK